MILFSTTISSAQDKEAKISLDFAKEDSLYVCKALVTSDEKPVSDVTVILSVKRLFSNLPIGEATTDSTGIASFEIPSDIPSKNGKLKIFANITDDDNYMNNEVSDIVNCGTIIVNDNSNIEERSISGGRSKAPIYIIICSLIAIGIVWGTLFYAVLQVFKIKKIGLADKTNN